LELPSRKDQDAFHAVAREAERLGALNVEWDRRAGTDGRIKRLVVQNADALAQFLGVSPQWEQVASAERVLAQWSERDRIKSLIGVWRAGQRPRSRGPERVEEFVDALKTLDACESKNGQDVPVRRLSGSLFGNTKRIENDLVGALDWLTIDSIDDPARERDEVLAELGLVRFPQPLLLAGSGNVELRDGTRLPIASPYLGISPEHLVGVHGAAKYLLTIENLTTFHEVARGAAGEVQGIVAYTGGMPSPSMRNAYAVLLKWLPDANIFHWGDTDLGGFRIAHRLSQITATQGRHLKLWQMGARDRVGGVAGEALTPQSLRRISQIAVMNGWDDAVAGLSLDPVAIEQETQPLLVPVPVI
jgi:hypothetical protein